MAFTLEDVTALTDEQITPEIEAVLLPKLAARATTYLANNGHVVKTKDVYDTEFNAAVSTREKAFADSEAPKFYGAMDKMLAAVGLTKPADTKTRDWVEKLSTEGKLPFTAEQWTKIDKALKGDGSPTDKGLADEYKKQLDQYIDEQKTKDQKKFDNTVSQIVSASFRTAAVVIDPNLKDETAKNTARKAGIDTITAVWNAGFEAAEDDKGVMFFKKKGTDVAIMDTATGLPMGPLEIMKKEYPTLFAAQTHQQKGGGSGGGGASGGAASSKADIYRAASDAGLRMHSPAWKEFVKAEEAKLK